MSDDERMYGQEPNKKQARAWLRRAHTIRLKAESLSYDVATVTGIEHSLTDWVDNVQHMAEELCDVLDKYTKLNP